MLRVVVRGINARNTLPRSFLLLVFRCTTYSIIRRVNNILYSTSTRQGLQVSGLELAGTDLYMEPGKSIQGH